MSEPQRIRPEMGEACDQQAPGSEPLRDPEEFLAQVQVTLEELICGFLRTQLLSDALSLSWVTFRTMELCRAVCVAFVRAWARLLEQAAVEAGLTCPECGQKRKICWRENQPLWVDLFCGRLCIRKPYLRCGAKDCSGQPLSVTRLLSGLRSGDSGLVLKLQAGRQGAEESYGKSARSLEEHPLGVHLERGKLRRLAIEVEDEAVEYREQQRRENSRPARLPDAGVPVLVLEGDGGSVRVGTYQTPGVGEKGKQERTPVRKLPRRRRPAEKREVITLDVRQPEEKSASALDVLMPVTAPPGERQRLMRALARRKGLGTGTEIYGLGDMGSALAPAFEQAFPGHPGFWQADEKHTRDYLRAVVPVLQGLNGERWHEALWSAIQQRDEAQRDALLEQAKRHRIASLPDGLKKCPVHALASYLHNNWDHMRFEEMKERGLPVVSARAESQVRDRTKSRFSVAGAWGLENVEPKAILRSIIAEGSFAHFTEWLYQKEQASFAQGLKERVEEAVEERRLDAKAAALLIGIETTLADLLEFRNFTPDHRLKQVA